jgi:hypothetical protein
MVLGKTQHVLYQWGFRKKKSNNFNCYFSTVLAITAPMINPQTGALICKNETCDNAMRKANSALKRFLVSQKPICRLDRRTPINENPANKETKACGNDWIKGTIFHANTPNTNVNIPEMNDATYRFDLIPASGFEQIAVIIPAIFELCPPNKPAIIEKIPLAETIFRIGGSNSELSNAPIPAAASLLKINMARGRANVTSPFHVNSGFSMAGKKKSIPFEERFKSVVKINVMKETATAITTGGIRLENLVAIRKLITVAPPIHGIAFTVGTIATT